MKKIVFYITLLLLFTSCLKDDGIGRNPIPLTEENIDILPININFSLEDIDFIDENNGFVIDYQGRVLSTHSAGNDWNVLYSTNYELLDIQFINEQFGYVLAKVPKEQKFFLLQTNDFGQTFQEISIPNGSGLTRVFFIDENIGFVLGNHTQRTENAGATWTEMDIGFKISTDILQTNDGKLYAYGGKKLFRSSDLGISWEQIDLGINSGLYKIKQFHDHFYLLGQKIVKTNLEETQEFEIPAYINDFHIYKENIVIGFGEQYFRLGFFPYGRMFISNNSGKTWDTIPLNLFQRIRTVDFIDSNNGFGIADNLYNRKYYLIKIHIEQ